MTKSLIRTAAVFGALIVTPAVARPVPLGDAETSRMGTFDNFSNVIVDRQRCPMVSLTMIAAPPLEGASKVGK